MEALLLFSRNAMSKKSSKESGRSKPPSSRSRRTTARRRSRRWSGAVTRHSNALDLESKVFKSTNPRRIALSLKRSAQASKRRKGTPYQSAMSMLNFYINRAGQNLPQKQKRVLERAKDELGDVFGRA
jgi:putative cell wall-binding protein